MAPAVSVVEYEIVPLTLYAFVVSKFVRFPAKNVRVTGIDWFVPTGATEFAVQLTSVVNAQMLFPINAALLLFVVSTAKDPGWKLESE